MSSMSEHVCRGEGCQKPATLQCPTCMKLGIPDSFFCSQSCFKDAWPTHKALHKKAVVNNSNTSKDGSNPWPGYKYTGPLRPHYPLSPRRPVPEHIARPDYAETGIALSEQNLRSSTAIEVLSKTDIDTMRRVCKLAREVMNIGLAAVKPGVTTDEIDRIVHEATIARDAYPSTLNYNGYKKSCCTSVNEVICHGVPDMRPLQEGDIVNLDISLFKEGFHADLNETVPVGVIDEAAQLLLKTTKECLDMAIASVKPGFLYRDLGNVIEKHAKSKGYSLVKSVTAHGIHRLFHCPPYIPHYARNKAIGVMKVGHVFTIEPMVSEGTWRDEIWPDEWTIVTQDGKRSAQYEQTMVVTETGVEILTV